MNGRAVTQLIIVATVLSQSAGELVAPQSTESKVGDTTYFNCSTNLTSKEIFWGHDLNYIYVGETAGILEPYRGRFKIDRNASNGSHNLVIHSVQPGDSGKYICIDDDGIGARRSAELIVLENVPDCQSNIHDGGVIGQNVFNITPDEVSLTCTVTYNGNIPPQMEWKKVGDNSSSEDNMTSSVISKNRLKYTLKLKGDISLDKSSYVCQTTRSTQNQYKCNSEIIQVLYFIDANKTQQNAVRGDELTCVASNNTFNCSSQWYHSSNPCLFSCDKTITTHLLGEYMCTVKCHVRGRDFYFEALKAVVAEVTTSPPTSKSGTIAASVVIPIVIILLVVLIAVYIVRRSKQKDEQKVQDVFGRLDMGEVKMAVLYFEDGVHNRVKREIPRDKVAEEEIELLYKIKKEVNIGEKEIRGVSILRGKLFIVREKISKLEVYDCSDFNPDRESPNVPELVDAVDICSCTKNDCLYIMDKKEGRTPKEVLKISTEGELLGNWSTKDNVGGYLSATAEGNVIITVQYKHNIMLLEYSSDGKTLSEIKLSGHINPWHAIKVENDRYIVSHGTIFDSVHKVCLVDKKGKVEKSFGRERGSAENQLNAPCYLAGGSNDCVMVADLGNNRVLLLDSNLKFKANIAPKYKQEFQCPRRVCLDGTLLVVVITEGNPKETEEETDISKEKDNLLRKTEKGNMEVVDASQLIEEDCRLLVFNINQ